jgi:hypothetical protein
MQAPWQVCAKTLQICAIAATRAGFALPGALHLTMW